jgi:hypothetical protein
VVGRRANNECTFLGAQVPHVVCPQVLTLLFPKYCTEGNKIEPMPSDYDRLFDNITRQMLPLSAEHPAVRSSATLANAPKLVDHACVHLMQKKSVHIVVTV